MPAKREREGPAPRLQASNPLTPVKWKKKTKEIYAAATAL